MSLGRQLVAEEQDIDLDLSSFCSLTHLAVAATTITLRASGEGTRAPPSLQLLSAKPMRVACDLAQQGLTSRRVARTLLRHEVMDPAVWVLKTGWQHELDLDLSVLDDVIVGYNRPNMEM